MKFTLQKNGYKPEEVDSFIEELEKRNKEELKEKQNEISSLKSEINKLEKKRDTITLALTAAVDKAKEIEESSKNIYKLKIEQLTILYSKWEILLNEMLKKYPNVSGISNTKEEMLRLKNSINDVLKDDFNIEIMNTNPATDPIRNLLNKFIGMKAKSNEIENITIKRKVKNSPADKTELEKLEESNNIKPITNIKLEENEQYENLVDKFLNDDDIAKNGFTKSLTVNKPTTSAFVPNETGFDLNECINPTNDLEEIMKSFDFYNKAN